MHARHLVENGHDVLLLLRFSWTVPLNPTVKEDHEVLDARQVLTARNLQVTIIAPSLAPRILHDPIRLLLVVLRVHTIPHQYYRMTAQQLAFCLVVDTHDVVHEVLINLKAGIQCAPGGDQLHHVFYGRDNPHAIEYPIVLHKLLVARLAVATPRMGATCVAHQLKVVYRRTPMALVRQALLHRHHSLPQRSRGRQSVPALAAVLVGVATHDALD
mmetsp:Transcript_105752/g.305958  ORF Transcript_105752/g.305958 Transcript_105752/m.305958 type:complete len:215 (+) Transcript_105752:430-1074(+)